MKKIYVGTPVAATFWVNASRVLPPLTIPNVKNTSIFILSLKEKGEKKEKKKKKKRQTEKIIKKKKQVLLSHIF